MTTGNEENPIVPQGTVAADGGLVLKLYYKRLQYTLDYGYDHTPEELNAIIGESVLPATTSHYYGATVPVAPDATAPGYTFSGWTVETGAANIVNGVITMPAGDVTIHGAFTANTDTPYRVEHYFENLHDDNFTLDATKTQNLTGKTGDEVTASPLTDLVGFTFDTAAENVKSGTVAGDGSLVLKLYYARTRHKVNYQYTGSVPADATVLTGVYAEKEYKYGQLVHVAPDATATGYTFSGWSAASLDVGSGSFTMPARDVVLSGYFDAAQNKYTVEHYLMGTDGKYPTTATYSSTYTNVKTNDPARANLKVAYVGFDLDEEKTTTGQNVVVDIVVDTINGYRYLKTTVAADGSTVLRLYFKRHTVKLTYDYEEGTVPAGAVPTKDQLSAYGGTYYFGQEVPIEAPATAPGYTFSGWSVSTGNAAITNGILTMPDQNVVLRGSFTANANTEYEIEHWFEDLNGNYYKDAARTEYRTGKTDVEVTAEPISDETVVGFRYDADKTAQDGLVSGTIAGDGSLVLRLYYTRTRHTVRYRYLSETTPSGATPLPADQVYVYGATVYVADTATAPGYSFHGWNKDNAPISGSFTMPAGDVSITGHFTPDPNKYTIEHYLMGLDGNYPDKPSRSTEYTEAVTGETVYANTGYVHAGFTFVQDHANNKISGVVAADGSLVLKLYYARNQYAVTYAYSGTVPTSANPTADGLSAYTATYYYGAEVTVATNAAAQGYTFSGWTVYTGQTSIENGKFIMPDRAVTLHGSFNARTDIPYTVEHYFENLEDDGFTLQEKLTEEKYGTTGNSITAEPRSGPAIAGFTFAPDVSGTIRTGTIPADGSLVLKLYYTRTRHSVSYQYTGNAPVDATRLPATQTEVKYGTPITVAPNAAAQGYTFSGWSATGLDVGGGSFTMPARDVILSGHFSAAANQYTIEHYLMDTNGAYPETPDHSETTAAMTDSYVEANTDVAHTGFTYDAVTTSDQYKGYVAADGGLVLKLYFARNQYKLSYLYDGTVPSDASVLPGTGTHYYGETVTVAPNATAAGYRFSGWRVYSGLASINGGTLTMPANNVVLHGSFTASDNTVYTVEHYFENLENDDFTLQGGLTQTLRGTTGAEVTAEPIADDRALGFDYQPTRSVHTGKIAADGSLVLALYYTRTRSSVSYQYTGTVPGGASDLPEQQLQIKYGTVVTVADHATATGYDFSGWSGSELSIKNGSFTMPARDVILSGHFSAASNKYVVEHYLMDLNGQYQLHRDFVYTDVVTGAKVKANTDITYTGFTYVPGLSNTEAEVAADGSTVLQLYYERNKFELTYEYLGTYDGASVLPAAASYYYGQTVTLAPDAVLAGYTFSGWSARTGNVTIANRAFVMPAQNVVLRGSFAADGNTPYTVQHWLEDLDGGYEIKYTENLTGETDTSVTAVALSDARVTGFKLNTDHSDFVQTGTIIGDGSLVLNLYYSRETYRVSYQYVSDTTPNDATRLPEPQTYKFGRYVAVAALATAEGYTFHGWNTDDVIVSGNGFYIGTQDVVFTGYFTPATNQYVIEHYLMGTDGQYPTSASHSMTYTNAKTDDVVSASTDVAHVGFTFDGDAPNVLSGTVAPDGDTVLKVYFKRDQFPISYVYEGTVPTTAPAAPTDSNHYFYQQQVELAPQPAVPGYSFQGWAVRTGGASITNGILTMPNSSVVLYGSFTPNQGTGYTVEHYFEDLDGNYHLDSSKTQRLTGKTGDTVTAEPLPGIVGHDFNVTMSESSRTGEIDGNGNLVLRLYYTRALITVRYQYSTTTIPGDATVLTGDYAPRQYKYGAPIQVADPATAQGYIFSGWSTHDVTVSGGSFTAPANNVTFVGDFAPASNKYVIEHYLMDTTGNYPATASHSSTYDNAKTGDAVSADTSVQHVGFYFDANAVGNHLSDTVMANGGTVLRVYFARQRYQVSYEYEGTGPEGRPAVPVDSNSYYYEQEVTIAPDAVLSGYTFSGWRLYTGDTSIENGKMKMPNKPVTLYGSFTARSDIPYEVQHWFEQLDGSYTLERTQSFTGKTDTYVTAMPVADTPGFRYNADLTARYNGMTQDAIPVPTAELSGNGKLVLYLCYDRSISPVIYQYSGTIPGNASNVPETVYVKYGAEITVEPNATAQGYKFSGWSTDDVTVTDGKFLMPNAEVILTGYFTAQPNKYVIEHHLMGLDGTYANGEVKRTEYDHAVTGTYVKASTDIQYEGFTYETTEDTVLSGQVLPNGSLVLKLYYRRNQYNVSYQYDGAEGTIPSGAPAVPTGGKAYYGEMVTLADRPNVAGYSFDGWAIRTGDTFIKNNNGTYQMQMPASDVVLRGSFNANTNTKYTVEHYFENLEDSDYTLQSNLTQVLEGTTGATAYAQPISDERALGFTFDSTITDTVQSGTITGDGNLVLKLYYNRTVHSVKYQFLGSAQTGAASELPETAWYKYGAAVTVDDGASVTGYTFSGWSSNEVTATTGETFTMPAGGVIFNGSFEPKPNVYKVEHYLMGTDGKYQEEPTFTRTYTNVVSGGFARANLNVSYPGFELVEPTPAAGQLIVNDTDNNYRYLQTTVAADGSTVLELYFERNVYSVTYAYTNKLTDVTVSELPAADDKVYYGEIVTVAPDATATGYTFMGWTIYTGDTAIETVVGSDGEKVKQFVMPAKNITLHGSFNPSANTGYKVEHYFETLDGYYVLDANRTQTLSGTTNATAHAVPLPDVVGFDYKAQVTVDNVKLTSESSGTIAADGSLTLKLYYQRMMPEVKYQITGTLPSGQTAITTETHKYGSTVTVAANPTVPGYTFTGWEAYSLPGVSAGDTFQMGIHSILFTGHFDPNPSHYTVEHWLQDAEGDGYTLDEAVVYATDVKVGQTVNASPRTYNTYSYTDAVSVPTGTVNDEGTLVLKLYYDRKTYDVSYQFVGVVPEGQQAPANQEDIRHGALVNLADITAPEGYRFEGWYDGETLVGGSLFMPSRDLNLTGRFVPRSDTVYTVKYFLQNLEDDNYTEVTADGYTATGTTGTYVAGKRIDYPGFTHNITKSNWNGHIKGDGSLVLHLYYDRNVYQLSYFYYGTPPENVDVYRDNEKLNLNGRVLSIHTEPVKYGASFVVGAPLTASDDSYEFKGWFTSNLAGVGYTTENQQGMTFTMPASNVNFYGALYNYVVFYELDGGKLNGAEQIDPKLVNWNEANLLPAGTPEKDGKTFTGWALEKDEPVPVTAETRFSELAISHDLVFVVLTAQYEDKADPTPPVKPEPEQPQQPPVRPETGAVTLHKVDAADPTTSLSGAQFELYRAGRLQGTYSTNAAGDITVYGLLPGEYSFVETRSPVGYELDSTVHSFTVQAGQQTTLTVSNAKSQVPSAFTDDHYAYVIGYDDGLVRPGALITRAEVATIFFRLLTDEVRAEYMTRENHFVDVPAEMWYNTAVSTMAAMGVINGYPDDSFNPGGYITRAEFAAIAARFDPNGNAAMVNFIDISDHWAKREISIAANNGWVTGYEDNSFAPNRQITRAEAMTMINRVLQRIPESVDDLLPEMVTWQDNLDPAVWYYLMVQEATNSHYYERKANGYERWQALRPVRDWAALEQQ